MQVQAIQLQAQAFIQERGLQQESEMTLIRTQEVNTEANYQATLKREQKLEKRIASMSTDLNALMDELHAHDEAAVQHQRDMRKQTKNREDLMDAYTQEIKQRDITITTLRGETVRLRELSKISPDPLQVLHHPEYLALQRKLQELEMQPNPECEQRCNKLLVEVHSVTVEQNATSARLQVARQENGM